MRCSFAAGFLQGLSDPAFLGLVGAEFRRVPGWYYGRNSALFGTSGSADEAFIVGGVGGLKRERFRQGAGLAVVQDSLGERDRIGKKAGGLNGEREIEELLRGGAVEAASTLQSSGNGSVVDCRSRGVGLALRNHGLSCVASLQTATDFRPASHLRAPDGLSADIRWTQFRGE